jgi:hypothetical protein
MMSRWKARVSAVALDRSLVNLQHSSQKTADFGRLPKRATTTYCGVEIESVSSRRRWVAKRKRPDGVSHPAFAFPSREHMADGSALMVLHTDSGFDEIAEHGFVISTPEGP